MRTAQHAHSSAASAAHTTVLSRCVSSTATAPSESSGHLSFSPRTTSHSPSANSGSTAIAAASPKAARVYTSVSRYAASV